jgi:AbrB family looped-hinge helix DNA binding protein
MVRMEFERKVGPKGQIVIPKEIRRVTGVLPKSKVLVTVKDREIIIRPEEEKPVWKIMEEFAKKRGKIPKAKDFDRWYEKELEEKWKRIESAVSRR